MNCWKDEHDEMKEKRKERERERERERDEEEEDRNGCELDATPGCSE